MVSIALLQVRTVFVFCFVFLFMLAPLKRGDSTGISIFLSDDSSYFKIFLYPY